MILWQTSDVLKYVNRDRKAVFLLDDETVTPNSKEYRRSEAVMTQAPHMHEMQTKSLDTPDETRNLPKTKVEVVTFGDRSIMRVTLEPGWKWSEHVKPTVGTQSCQVERFGYCISGRLRVRMDDGTEAEIRPGDADMIPPGHDAWVIGDQPFIGLDVIGGPIYGQPKQ